MTGFEVVLMIVGVITMIVLVTVAFFIILKGIYKLIAWLWERRQKQAIYWNEKEKQIKTRSGECIFNKRVMNKLCADAQRVRDEDGKIEEYNKAVVIYNRDNDLI